LLVFQLVLIVIKVWVAQDFNKKTYLRTISVFQTVPYREMYGSLNMMVWMGKNVIFGFPLQISFGTLALLVCLVIPASPQSGNTVLPQNHQRFLLNYFQLIISE
jgi:hypothetical protein